MTDIIQKTYERKQKMDRETEDEILDRIKALEEENEGSNNRLDALEEVEKQQNELNNLIHLTLDILKGKIKALEKESNNLTSEEKSSYENKLVELEDKIKSFPNDLDKVERFFEEKINELNYGIEILGKGQNNLKNIIKTLENRFDSLGEKESNYLTSEEKMKVKSALKHKIIRLYALRQKYPDEKDNVLIWEDDIKKIKSAHKKLGL